MKNKKKIFLTAIILIILVGILEVWKLNLKTTTLEQLKNSGHSQMMGYIIKTDNDKIIVIDGGTSDDTENLLQKINEYTGKVDYWFITHPHQDHATAFIEIVNNYNIDIGKVYVTTEDEEWYNKYGDGADVCVTEGVMGLFDGYQRMQGSSAEIARLLNIPVVLIVSARSTAYSVAPLIYGFKHFNPAVKIAGIVFNQVSSPSHFAYLREACVDAGVECLGYLPMTEGLKIPSRHLGLTLTAKRSMNTLIEQAAELVGKYVDLDKLLSICHRNFPCRYTLPYSSETGVESFTPSAKKMKIAIARDPAFNFIYRENIDRLSALGSITYFSPVYGSDLPDADLVYLPGGYPELFARQLHRRKKLMEALRTYAEEGGKILAECGGMMFLTRSLTARQGGTAYAMTGILPLDCTMVGARLHLGYRRIEYKGMELRGHEFHYSNVVAPDAMPSVAKQFTARGMEVSTPLYRYKNVIAGYTHLYWGETDILKLWKV